MARPIDEQSLDFMPPIYWQPQHELQAFAKDDDEQDDEQDDDEQDDDEDDDEDDELDGDEAKKELARLREKLKRSDAANARRRLSERKKKSAESKPKPKEGEDEDVETRIAAARAEVETKANARIKASEAKAALRDAGVAPDRLARAIRALPLDELEVDDEGTIGLDDAIDELRDDFPELFEKPRRRRRAAATGNDREGSGNAQGDDKRSVSQRQADKLLGRK